MNTIYFTSFVPEIAIFNSLAHIKWPDVTHSRISSWTQLLLTFSNYWLGFSHYVKSVVNHIQTRIVVRFYNSNRALGSLVPYAFDERLTNVIITSRVQYSLVGINIHMVLWIYLCHILSLVASLIILDIFPYLVPETYCLIKIV